MRQPGRWITCFAVLLLTSACAGENQETAIDEDVEDRTPYEEAFVTADTSEGYDYEPGEPGEVPPVTPVQGGRTVGGPLTATGNFRPIEGGISPGSVTLTEQDGSTQVIIEIDRYTSGTELQAVVVDAPCDTPGQVVATVPGTLTVGPSGVATLNARIGIPTSRLLGSRSSVRLVNPGAATPQADAPEMVFACANMPEAQREA